jgi:large subunit ribosomal protein L21
MDNKFAVIMTGGKQYLVKPGDNLKIEKIDAEKGDFDFDKVLLVADGENLKIGKPFLNDVKIPAEVLGQGRGKKVIVAKFKSKTRFHKKAGHRQPYTEVKITNF